jgi:hypothetical protein
MLTTPYKMYSRGRPGARDLCTPALWGRVHSSSPLTTPLVRLSQYPSQYQFFPSYFAITLLCILFLFDTPTRGPRNFICCGPNVPIVFLPGLRSKHKCTLTSEQNSLLINKVVFDTVIKTSVSSLRLALQVALKMVQLPKTEVTHKQTAKL